MTQPSRRSDLRTRFLAVVLWAAASSVMAFVSVAIAATPSDTELASARAWVAGRLQTDPSGQPLRLPVTFTYGGQPSSELLPTWTLVETTETLDHRRTRSTLQWTDPKTGLIVKCVATTYLDFSAVDWVATFTNSGSVDTPILENVQALDEAWQRGGEGEFLLHHAVGSPANGSDYGPLETPLGPDVAKRIGAAGGRPTNTDLSYFNLEWNGQGVVMAVGWPGQWLAEFQRDNTQKLHIRAGQELTHLKLLPGEEVRTPLMALLFWEGKDWIRGQNLWRSWMIAHNLPRPGGHLPPPQFVASSSRAYEEMIGANEANQIMHIDRYLEEQLKLDYWWMDAGWYVQKQGWPQVGTWEVDPQRFPRGLRPISDHGRERGVKTLVWFEPERVAPGTWLYDTHPEWLLSSESNRALQGMRGWSSSDLGNIDPCVVHNGSDQPVTMSGIRWEPGQLSLHPGPRGEYGVVRWTAPAAGTYKVSAVFSAIDQQTTTDVHLLHQGRELFAARLRLDGQGPQAESSQEITLAQGDTLDCVVGWGNGAHICDSTGLALRITDSAGQSAEAAADFRDSTTESSPWSYGYLPPAEKPDVSGFRPFDRLGRPGDGGTKLLNLGNADARQWLTDHIDQLLTDQGIDLYRQDFNMDPLAFWRANDPDDRQGISENHHVTGYLAYWDELRRRHPDMLIDTCASGGRRNDLETLRRAVPLWRSDYAFEPVGHQCMTYGISLWIPYHGTGTVACANAGYYGGGATPVEPYAFWSNAAPSLGSGIDIRVREIDYNALRKLLSQWRDVNRFYYADFYPLTDYTRDANVWIAWQFHDADEEMGTVQAFRRTEDNAPTLKLKLQGIDPAGSYEFTRLDSGEVQTCIGTDLLETGLEVTLSERPAAAIYRYRRVVANLEESLGTVNDRELFDHVRYLADDALQGRSLGTPGGKAAALYLAQEFKELGLQPAGTNGQYLQEIERGGQNVLGLLKGSDPALSEETIIVGGHFDHVGVRRSRFGLGGKTPPAVYNGANDNASGTAGILEIAETFAKLPQAPRRSILFALWDGEERGFVGSRFFVNHPTIDLDRVAAALAIDMIGRVANNQFVVWGSGTASGWRELFTTHNQIPQLDIEFREFTLALSDHRPFFERGTPAVLPSSGLYAELHQTTDDVELINAEGMRRVTQLLAGVVYELAMRDGRLEFIADSKSEASSNPRRTISPPVPQPDDQSHKLGFTYRSVALEPNAWIVVQVTPGSPAATLGLRTGDRLRTVAGTPVTDVKATELGEGAVELQVERNGRMLTLGAAGQGK